MPAQADARNFRAYRFPEGASHYATLNYMTRWERALFRTHLKPGMSVLDQAGSYHVFLKAKTNSTGEEPCV